MRARGLVLGAAVALVAAIVVVVVRGAGGTLFGEIARDWAARGVASLRISTGGRGGSVTETGTRRDKVRGIDRDSDDRTPKNLTKKLKNQEWHRKRAEAFARGEVLKKN